VAHSTPSHLRRQLGRVSRRLFVQDLIDALIWCCAGALVLSAVWFLAQPYLFDNPPDWLRWAVAGGMMAAAIGIGVTITVLRRASDLEAALSLDAKFGLRERVTTALSLTPTQTASPAGQALLADVNQRIAGLDVRSRFPFSIRWSIALVPACGILLALIAFFYEPTISRATTTDENDPTQPLPNAVEVNQKMKMLEKKPVAERKKGEEPQSEKLKQIEEELDKLTIKPRDTRKDAQDRVKEMAALEDQIEKQQKENADKAQALKEQLKQMDRLSKKPKQDGPGKDLDKAVKDGDLDKARDEADRLAKKLKDQDLSDKDKEELTRQLQDLEDDLQRLTRQQKEEEERLEKELEKEKEKEKKGEKSKADELQRELDELKKNEEKTKDGQQDLKDAAEELGKCQQCMKEGKDEEAAEHLKKAGEKMEKAEGKGENKQMGQKLEQLRAAKKAMCQGLDRKSKKPGGLRPETKDSELGSQDQRTKADLTKGQLRIEGFQKGDNLKRPKKSSEMAGDIKQASQDAPEAIDRLRIPKGRGDISKAYFDNLRQQSEKDAKDGKKP
jgi:hypothetical protein